MIERKRIEMKKINTDAIMRFTIDALAFLAIPFIVTVSILFVTIFIICYATCGLWRWIRNNSVTDMRSNNDFFSIISKKDDDSNYKGQR